MEIDWMARCPLFRGLKPKEAEECLAGQGSRRAYQKGDTIYDPHTFSRSLGILLEGSVQVSRDRLPVSRLTAGDLFGAAALYNREPDYVTTLTARSGCAVLFFTQEEMDGLLARRPALARNYIAYLSGRIRFLSEKVEELSGPTVEERLLRCLTAQARQGIFTPGCSWSELAKRLGMGRASLYRALEELEQAGALRREGKAIRLFCKEEEEI